MDPRRVHAFCLTMVAAICLLILAFAFPARAAEMENYTVNTGSVYQLNIVVCGKQASAAAIADAVQISPEHAVKLYDELSDCDRETVLFRVGAVVHSIKGNEEIVYRVVEIHHSKDPKQKAYWLTNMQIAPAKKGKQSDEIQEPKAGARRGT